MKKYIFLAIFALSSSVAFAQYPVEKTINPFQFYIAHLEKMPVGKGFVEALKAYDKDTTFTNEVTYVFREYDKTMDGVVFINSVHVADSTGQVKAFTPVQGFYVIRSFMEGTAKGEGKIKSRGNYFLIKAGKLTYAVILFFNKQTQQWGMYAAEYSKDVPAFNKLPLERQITFFKDVRLIAAT